MCEVSEVCITLSYHEVEAARVCLEHTSPDPGYKESVRSMPLADLIQSLVGLAGRGRLLRQVFSQRPASGHAMGIQSANREGEKSIIPCIQGYSGRPKHDVILQRERPCLGRSLPQVKSKGNLANRKTPTSPRCNNGRPTGRPIFWTKPTSVVASRPPPRVMYSRL